MVKRIRILAGAAALLAVLLAAGCAGADAEASGTLEASEISDAPPPEEELDETESSDFEIVEAEQPLTLEEVRTVTFQDVASDALYADCVSYAAHEGLLSGVGPDRFDPDGLATRAMVFAVLYRMSGQEAPAYDGSFDDVQAGMWYTGAVAWAVQAGLVDTGGNLGPMEPIRRSDLAVLLYRFAAFEDGRTYDETLSAYSDAGYVPEYARLPMAWALENRLFAGVVSDAIYPDLPISRAQLAQILVALTAYNEAEPVAEALTIQLNAAIAVSFSQEAHDSIQLLVDTAASKYGAVGVQVAVVEDGKVIDAFTYGWAVKDSVAMTEDHKIRSASITKVAVGISAMLLREQGVITLDDDIGDYWSISARNPYYPDTPITIRSLLSHTSSIRVLEEASRTNSAVKSTLASSSGYSRMKPGAITSWNYNNYAFGVLGMTLEMASGRYLDQIMDQSIWGPMEIDAAFEGGCIENTDLLAALYYHGGGMSRSVAAQKELSRPDTPGGKGTFFAGGLTINAKDLAKMAAMLANDGSFEGVQLLSRESVELMESRYDYQLSDGTYQALPLRSQDDIYGRDRLYYHTGSAYGVYNFMSYDPAARDGVVVLTVGASGAKDDRGIYAICGEISDGIYRMMEDSNGMYTIVEFSGGDTRSSYAIYTESGEETEEIIEVDIKEG